jgi:hypothetical protein
LKGSGIAQVKSLIYHVMQKCARGPWWGEEGRDKREGGRERGGGEGGNGGNAKKRTVCVGASLFFLISFSFVLDFEVLVKLRRCHVQWEGTRVPSRQQVLLDQQLV